MRSGELRDKVKILEKRTTRNDYGEEITEYYPLITLAAKVIEKGGRESEKLSQLHAENDVSFIVRYRQNIHAKMRLQWAGREFDIEHVGQQDNTREALVLTCKEYKHG